MRKELQQRASRKQKKWAGHPKAADAETLGRGAWGPVRTTDEWNRAATATRRREMTIFTGRDKELSESRRGLPSGLDAL